jgi:hypothetical protein
MVGGGLLLQGDEELLSEREQGLRASTVWGSLK